MGFILLLTKYLHFVYSQAGRDSKGDRVTRWEMLVSC